MIVFLFSLVIIKDLVIKGLEIFRGVVRKLRNYS